MPSFNPAATKSSDRVFVAGATVGIYRTAQPRGPDYGKRQTDLHVASDTAYSLYNMQGKLNIAHHKSYHPYRADNIERVRRDEEEARRKEELEEGRVLLADSEARLSFLRDRAGGTSSSSSRKRAARAKDDLDMKKIKDGTLGLVPSSNDEVTTLTTSSGHINLFSSLESSMSSQQLQLIDKKAKEAAAAKEADKGAPLAPSAHDLKPWYTDRELKGGKERDRDMDDVARNQQMLKEMAAKSSSDPLKAMNPLLARRAQVLFSPSTAPIPSPSSQGRTTAPSSAEEAARLARLNREKSERARAQALIARRQRELQASERDSTVGADTPREYGNVFNVREVREAAERRRSHNWGSRRWDDDDRDRRPGRRRNW